MNKANTNQISPLAGRDVVGDYVIEDINSRIKLGYDKYQTKLMSFNGRDPLWDAYQELIDLIFYVRQELLERNKNIALDLDDVVFSTAPEILSRLKKAGYKVKPFNKISNFNLEEFTNAPEEVLRRCIGGTLKSYLGITEPSTLDVINSLSNRFNLFFISNRREELREHTNNNLKKFGIKNYKLLLANERIGKTRTPNKLDLLLENNISLMVDDRLDTLNHIKLGSDIHTIVYDRPWNRNKNLMITRIFSLNALLTFI